MSAFAKVVLSLLLGALFTAGATIAANPPTPVKRVVVLLGGLPATGPEVQQFRRGMEDAGYTEGRDVIVEYRSAEGEYSKVPQLAAELVRSHPDVIVVENTVGAQAVKRATSTIPIVMALVGDPVGSGLVASLAQPGGNVTGLSLMTAELSVKRLQLLKEALPSLTRVGVFWNPDSVLHRKVVNDLKAQAGRLPVRVVFVEVSAPEKLPSAFRAALAAHARALYVIEDLFFSVHRKELLKGATEARLPVMYGFREFAAEGALITYGPSLGDLFRRSAGYVDKILKGANPGSLPVEQPTKFEMAVNVKVAKGLGLTVPQSVLVQADEVIQ